MEADEPWFDYFGPWFDYFCLKVVLCGQVPETLSLTVNDYSNIDQAAAHRSAESLWR